MISFFLGLTTGIMVGFIICGALVYYYIWENGLGLAEMYKKAISYNTQNHEENGVKK